MLCVRTCSTQQAALFQPRTNRSFSYAHCMNVAHAPRTQVLSSHQLPARSMHCETTYALFSSPSAWLIHTARVCQHMCCRLIAHATLHCAGIPSLPAHSPATSAKPRPFMLYASADTSMPNTLSGYTIGVLWGSTPDSPAHLLLSQAQLVALHFLAHGPNAQLPPSKDIRPRRLPPNAHATAQGPASYPPPLSPTHSLCNPPAVSS